MKKQALWTLVVVAVPVLAAAAADEKQATVAYVQWLQLPGTGFMPEAPRKDPPAPTLRSTSSALRALKHNGGEPKDVGGCRELVRRCFDKESGGYADTPGGKPDVFATVAGIACATELKMPREEYVAPAVKFLAGRAKTFEEVRIAAAGLETAGAKVPEAKEWVALVGKMRKPDGSFGGGAGAARDTGGAAVVLLRLAGELPQRSEVLRALRAGQRADGGFGMADSRSSDLETTYRVMRCFAVLKEKPADIAKVGAFVKACRNADGGYGVAPGQTSTVSGTYFAAMVGHWLGETGR